MQYMVIERFKAGKTDELYARFHENGRMLPDGLIYINSWLTADRSTCFQLMSTSDPSLFDEWIEKWSDLTDFEIIELASQPPQAAAEQSAQ